MGILDMLLQGGDNFDRQKRELHSYRLHLTEVDSQTGSTNFPFLTPSRQLPAWCVVACSLAVEKTVDQAPNNRLRQSLTFGTGAIGADLNKERKNSWLYNSSGRVKV